MKKITLSLFIIFIVSSCEKDELGFREPIEEKSEITEDNSRGFRRKVKNPYTISNMQIALDSINNRIKDGKLKSTTNAKASAPEIEIKPNVLYIQFTPKTFEQEGKLKKDSTLALIDYPLGYEYDEAWFENRPQLGKDEIPAYYTSVSVDRELPKGVPHKVLAEMYLPQVDKNLENIKGSLYRTKQNETGGFIDVLLNQAFKQTDNEGLDGLGILEKQSESNQSQNKVLGIGIGDKWHPAGILRIWDDNIGTTIPYERELVGYEYYHCDGDESVPTNELISVEDARGDCRREIYANVAQPRINGSYVPLKGAQVLLRDTFTIGNEITDENGYFSFDELRGDKRYIIQWERYEYSIRNGSLFQAETRGPKQNTRWDYDIKGGDDEYHGMIHLGAYDYYYGSRFGLTSPPTNFFTGRQLKIAAREIDGGSTGSSYSHIKNDLSLGIAAQIHIKAWSRSSDRIYGTTVHELAHASHSMVDRGSYDNIVRDAWIIPWQGGAVENNNRRLLETWARTVEIMFSLKRYRDDAGNPNYEYGNSDRRNYRNLQNLRILDEIHYTSAGYDMIDNINQRSDTNFGNGSKSYPIDRVEGYTLKELESALVDARYWNQWRDNIISKYDNSTERYLTELFNNWPN